jgi:hypothetical protein
MSNRITEKQLQSVCDLINKETDSPMQPWVKNSDGKHVAQIGNYHISGAYGGVCLHRMVNEAGGVSDVFYCGHVPKRELFNMMHAFLAGIAAA